MSEKMDAEEVTEIMNRVWRKLDAVIGEHGGRIDKHIGDAVMALWGVKTASENDPEQAIRTALAMQDWQSCFGKCSVGPNIVVERWRGGALSEDAKLAAMLGGEISVESQEGEGSRFDVRFPRAPVESVGAAAAGPPGGATPPSHQYAARMPRGSAGNRECADCPAWCTTTRPNWIDCFSSERKNWSRE